MTVRRIASMMAIGMAVLATRRASAQYDLTFDASNSCAIACSPFTPLLATYGSVAGVVNVTNGVLASFGSNTAVAGDGMYWYGGFGPFSSGFGIGFDSSDPSAVGEFTLSAVNPLQLVTFEGMDMSSSAARTAHVEVYDLSGNLLWNNSFGLNANVVTNSGVGPSAAGGLRIEFNEVPDQLVNLWIDNFKFDVGAPSTPQEVTPEPTTMSLLAVGLVGLAARGVRRRKK